MLICSSLVIFRLGLHKCFKHTCLSDGEFDTRSNSSLERSASLQTSCVGDCSLFVGCFTIFRAFSWSCV